MSLAGEANSKILATNLLLVGEGPADRAVEHGRGHWRAAVQRDPLCSAVPIGCKEQTLDQLSSAHMPEVGGGNGRAALVGRPVDKSETAETLKET